MPCDWPGFCHRQRLHTVSGLPIFIKVWILVDPFSRKVLEAVSLNLLATPSIPSRWISFTATVCGIVPAVCMLLFSVSFDC
jgi:hypothetical protein